MSIALTGDNFLKKYMSKKKMKKEIILVCDKCGQVKAEADKRGGDWEFFIIKCKCGGRFKLKLKK